MKKSLFFVVAVVALGLTLGSCKSEKKSEPKEEKILIDVPQDSYSKDDTAQVFALVEDFLARLRNHDISSAVSMLKFLDGDTIRDLSRQQYNSQAMTFANVHGVKYDIERLVFDSEKDNDVTITVTMFENKPGENRPNKIGLHLRPVRRDGAWYLTTPNTLTDTNSDEEHTH